MLSSYVVDELREVVERKAPTTLKALDSAIIAEADILIIGDRDFADIDIEKPEIMTPTQFTENYISK